MIAGASFKMTIYGNAHGLAQPQSVIFVSKYLYSNMKFINLLENYVFWLMDNIFQWEEWKFN